MTWADHKRTLSSGAAPTRDLAWTCRTSTYRVAGKYNLNKIQKYKCRWQNTCKVWNLWISKLIPISSEIFEFLLLNISLVTILRSWFACFSWRKSSSNVFNFNFKSSFSELFDLQYRTNEFKLKSSCYIKLLILQTTIETKLSRREPVAYLYLNRFPAPGKQICWAPNEIIINYDWTCQLWPGLYIYIDNQQLVRYC